MKIIILFSEKQKKGGKDIEILTIPLISDMAFNHIFKQEENLKYFLEDFLKEKIKYIEYDDPVFERDNKEAKECRLDIRVHFNNETMANIEMQRVEKSDIFDRALFYISQMIIRTLKISREYEEIKRCIQICIIAYDDKRFNEFHNILKLYSKNDIKKLLNKIIGKDKKVRYNEKELDDLIEQYILSYEKLEIHFINLTKEASSEEENKWKKMFIEKDVNKMLTNDERLNNVVKQLQILNADEEALLLYDIEEKRRRDYLDEMSTARKKGYSSGFNEGIEKGIEQGIEKGIEQGIETTKKLNAINMYKKHISKDLICDCLDITVEELNSILNVDKE